MGFVIRDLRKYRCDALPTDFEAKDVWALLFKFRRRLCKGLIAVYEATFWERSQFVEFISSRESEVMWSMIYEIIHILTAVVNESKEWSSQ